MNIEELKSKVVKANNAYRTGTPIISDEEYDALLEKLEEEMGFIEFEVFKQSLTEEKGTVSNSYVLGSLTKYKFEEADKLHKWIKEQKIKKLFCSDKIDGCSFYAEYRNGNLTLLSSRGDGDTGTDWTSKAKYINIPQTLPTKDDIDIRGELSLLGDSYTTLGFKTKRNGTVGIMNAKDIEPNKLKYVHAITYEVLSDSMNIKNQFSMLLGLGFKTSGFTVIEVSSNVHEDIKTYYLDKKANAEYDMDGIVISDIEYVPENTFFPKGKVAFKINSTGVKTTVKGIEWNVSKGGLVKPVVLVEPTNIDGTTVQRVTGFNAKYILDNQIGEGTTVYIVRSGEVIPKIVKVENGN